MDWYGQAIGWVRGRGVCVGVGAQGQHGGRQAHTGRPGIDRGDGFEPQGAGLGRPGGGQWLGQARTFHTGGGEHHGVELVHELLRGDLFANLSAAEEFHALALNCRDEMFILGVDDKRGTDVGIHTGHANHSGFVT